MLWNNTALNKGVFQDIDFLCSTNSANYTIEHKTRNVNSWLDLCVTEILDSMDDWDFQGEIATAGLTANLQEYPFPTDILKVKRIEVDYNDNDKFSPVTIEDINIYPNRTLATTASINDYFSSSDPKAFLLDNSIFLAPVPESAVTSGMKIWYEKNVTQFTATAAMNAQEPPIARPFHKILSLGAAADYARKFQMAELIAFCERELYGTTSTRQGRVGGLFTRLKKFYSTRSGDKILSIKSRYYKINYK